MNFYPDYLVKASSAFKAALLSFAAIAFLAACTTTTPPPQNPYPGRPVQGQTPDLPGPQQPQNPGPQEPQTPQPKQPDGPSASNGLTPPFMAGKQIKRVALVLPFSSRSARLREEAASMLQAAELSLFARPEDDVLLIALDSAGTALGAQTAARAAIDEGADIILGPVLAGSVSAASREARKARIPVIAFSTDTSVAGNGTYLLSFPPEAEVGRITEYAASLGASKFAYLGPDSAYGRRVLSAYREDVKNIDGIINGVESYAGQDITVMQEPARRIAELYTKAQDQGGDPAYHAILLPEGGTPLRSLAPLLPYFDVNPADVQFMGTGLWNREEVVREPALNGGIFAGPDMDEKEKFEARYDAVYGAAPGSLASLAYDAVNIGAYIASFDKKEQSKRLTDKAGFFGVDGLVRFGADGQPQRGLAVYQIRGGRFVVIDAAPRSSDPSG